MRKNILLALAMAATVVPAFAAQKTVTLEVPGMTCAACPITVRKALTKVDGVTRAVVDYDKRQAIVTFGFPRVLPMKAWFATGAFVLALVQLYSALRMWDRIHFPRVKPKWLPTAHRWSR